MKEFDVSRSDKIVEEFMAKEGPFDRKVLIFGREFNAPPEVVFPQFCPAREADWINGWTVDLIYTETGYAEPLAVFRTPASNVLGAGLWMLTTVEPNRLLEAVMFQQDHDVLEHMRLVVVDLGDGRTEVTWTITMTALSEKGNAVLDMVPDEEPAFVGDLTYFLMHGQMRELAPAP